MKSIWILAGADPAPESTEVITMEKTEQATETATQSDGSADSPEAPVSPKQQQNPTFFYLMLGLLAVFLFMTFMSPRKRQKEHQKMMDELKVGDRVITAGGIYGKVESLGEDSVVIRVESDAKIRVARNSVALKRPS